MTSILFDIVVIFLLILASGFFAGVEIAVVAFRRSRIRELIEQDNKQAKLVQSLLDDPDKFFALVQIGMTVFPVAASALGGVTAVVELKPLLDNLPIFWIQRYSESIAVGIVVMLVSYLTLVIGELAPKSIGLRFPEQISLYSARLLIWLLQLSHLFIRFLSFSTNLVLRPFKFNATFSSSHPSEDELRLMIEEGRKTGVIDKMEHELIASIFEFTDTTAKEVMVPRTDIVAVEINTPRENLIKIVSEEGYSRLPVYKENIDNIIGIIYTKDFISLLEHRDLIVLQDIIRLAYFVPETKKISQLMRELQRQKLHMAVVVNEFGGVEGIITMEDILEEIVGEIHDEYDEELKELEASADGAILVNARMTVNDFNKKLNVEIPEDTDYETISGFLHKVTGRIPDLNEEIRYKNLTFMVIKKSERRIRQVKVKKVVERRQFSLSKN